MNHDNTINYGPVTKNATYTGNMASSGGSKTVKITDMHEAIEKTSSIARVVEEGVSFLQRYSADVNELIRVWSGSDATVHINHLKEVYTWNREMLRTALAVGANAYMSIENMAKVVEANGGESYSLPGISIFQQTDFGQEIGEPNVTQGIDFNGQEAEKVHQNLTKDFSMYEIGRAHV